MLGILSVSMMFSSFNDMSAEGRSSTLLLLTCKQQEQKLVAYFANPDIWKKPSPEFDANLQLACKLRPRDLIPVLYKNFTYYDSNCEKLYLMAKSPEIEYPVYNCLKSYGPTAIPDLMMHLKRREPFLQNRESAIELSLAVHLLMGMSDDREVGAALARIRIQHEIDRAPQANFPRLKSLLSNQLLK